jgi:predicted nuclease of predicted toxin-antitoxin system
LIDVQLPLALVDWFAQQGQVARHVEDIGLLDADDREIWREAAANGWILVTKDRDFEQLTVNNLAGPQVLWLRIGNAPNRRLFERLTAAWPRIEESLATGVRIVEAH